MRDHRDSGANWEGRRPMNHQGKGIDFVQKSLEFGIGWRPGSVKARKIPERLTCELKVVQIWDHLQRSLDCRTMMKATYTTDTRGSLLCSVPNERAHAVAEVIGRGKMRGFVVVE